MLNNYNLRQARKLGAFEGGSIIARKMARMGYISLILILGSSLLVICAINAVSCTPAHADTVVVSYDKKAILAIIGEAEDQGYQGMYAVACALRNRKTLAGVYGVDSPRVANHRFSMRIYRLAQKAWEASAIGPDITHGAQYWENTNAFGCPIWCDKMTLTLVFKDHKFFREN